MQVDGLRERCADADPPVSFLRGGSNLLVGDDPSVMFGISEDTILIHPIALKPGEEFAVGPATQVRAGRIELEANRVHTRIWHEG